MTLLTDCWRLRRLRSGIRTIERLFTGCFTMVRLRECAGSATISSATHVFHVFQTDNTFPAPNYREYVFEKWVKRSGPLGRKLKQRMYALLGEGEFRIVEEVVKDAEYW